MVSSLLSVGYLMIVPVRAFFSPAPNPHGKGHGEGGIREAPLPSLIAIVITSLCCFALFVYPDPFFRLISMVAGP